MSQPPFPQYPGQPYQPPAAPRSNGWAIASLVCGIAGCLAITPILGIIFGILGISASKQPGRSGKGMAIAGIVLSLLWCIGLIGGIVGTLKYGPGIARKGMATLARPIMTEFVSNLSAGDVQKAGTHTTSKLTQTQLTALSEQIKSQGKFNSISIGTLDIQATTPGQVRLPISGTITFENGNKEFTAMLVGSSNNNTGTDPFKIEDFTMP